MQALFGSSATLVKPFAREYALAESVLSRWRREYQERGESAFLPPQSGESSTQEQRIAELERFCGPLALENQVLKKAL